MISTDNIVIVLSSRLVKDYEALTELPIYNELEVKHFGEKPKLFPVDDRPRLSDSIFGFTYGFGVWHWFRFDNINNYVTFTHSYSQNNGKTYKSYRKGFKIIRRLEEIIRSCKKIQQPRNN